jgi:hypothetical protein
LNVVKVLNDAIKHMRKDFITIYSDFHASTSIRDVSTDALRASQPPNQNCADDNDVQNRQLDLAFPMGPLAAFHTKPILFNRAFRSVDISFLYTFLYLRCVETQYPSL